MGQRLIGIALAIVLLLAPLLWAAPVPARADTPTVTISNVAMPTPAAPAASQPLGCTATLSASQPLTVTWDLVIIDPNGRLFAENGPQIPPQEVGPSGRNIGTDLAPSSAYIGGLYTCDITVYDQDGQVVAQAKPAAAVTLPTTTTPTATATTALPSPTPTLTPRPTATPHRRQAPKVSHTPPLALAVELLAPTVGDGHAETVLIQAAPRDRIKVRVTSATGRTLPHTSITLRRTHGQLRGIITLWTHAAPGVAWVTVTDQRGRESVQGSLSFRVTRTAR